MLSQVLKQTKMPGCDEKIVFSFSGLVTRTILISHCWIESGLLYLEGKGKRKDSDCYSYGKRKKEQFSPIFLSVAVCHNITCLQDS